MELVTCARQALSSSSTNAAGTEAGQKVAADVDDAALIYKSYATVDGTCAAAATAGAAGAATAATAHQGGDEDGHDDDYFPAEMFIRSEPYELRRDKQIQTHAFPTTTIGSFPQTAGE